MTEPIGPAPGAPPPRGTEFPSAPPEELLPPPGDSTSIAPRRAAVQQSIIEIPALSIAEYQELLERIKMEFEEVLRAWEQAAADRAKSVSLWLLDTTKVITNFRDLIEQFAGNYELLAQQINAQIQQLNSQRHTYNNQLTQDTNEINTVNEAIQDAAILKFEIALLQGEIELAEGDELASLEAELAAKQQELSVKQQAITDYNNYANTRNVEIAQFNAEIQVYNDLANILNAQIELQNEQRRETGVAELPLIPIYDEKPLLPLVNPNNPQQIGIQALINAGMVPFDPLSPIVAPPADELISQEWSPLAELYLQASGYFENRIDISNYWDDQLVNRLIRQLINLPVAFIDRQPEVFLKSPEGSGARGFSQVAADTVNADFESSLTDPFFEAFLTDTNRENAQEVIQLLRKIIAMLNQLLALASVGGTIQSLGAVTNSLAENQPLTKAARANSLGKQVINMVSNSDIKENFPKIIPENSKESAEAAVSLGLLEPLIDAYTELLGPGFRTQFLALSGVPLDLLKGSASPILGLANVLNDPNRALMLKAIGLDTLLKLEPGLANGAGIINNAINKATSGNIATIQQLSKPLAQALKGAGLGAETVSVIVEKISESALAHTLLPSLTESSPRDLNLSILLPSIQDEVVKKILFKFENLKQFNVISEIREAAIESALALGLSRDEAIRAANKTAEIISQGELQESFAKSDLDKSLLQHSLIQSLQDHEILNAEEIARRTIQETLREFEIVKVDQLRDILQTHLIKSAALSTGFASQIASTAQIRPRETENPLQEVRLLEALTFNQFLAHTEASLIALLGDEAREITSASVRTIKELQQIAATAFSHLNKTATEHYVDAHKEKFKGFADPTTIALEKMTRDPMVLVHTALNAEKEIQMPGLQGEKEWIDIRI